LIVRLSTVSGSWQMSRKTDRAEAGKGKAAEQEAERLEAADFLHSSEEGDLVLGLKLVNPCQKDYDL